MWFKSQPIINVVETFLSFLKCCHERPPDSKEIHCYKRSPLQNLHTSPKATKRPWICLLEYTQPFSLLPAIFLHMFGKFLTLTFWTEIKHKFWIVKLKVNLSEFILHFVPLLHDLILQNFNLTPQEHSFSHFQVWTFHHWNAILPYLSYFLQQPIKIIEDHRLLEA